MKQAYRIKFKKGASTVTGTMFTIRWSRFKKQVEDRNNRRLGDIVAVRVDKDGIHVFSEGGDMCAWTPEF